MQGWDVIVVGAGPAGCAAAYDLATAGHRVLLLDKADFPRQKACAGGLTLKSVKALRYSVEPVIRQHVKTMRLERDRNRSLLVQRKAPYCAMTVRAELDEYCLRQTLQAGAAFQRIAKLTSITECPDEIRIEVGAETLTCSYLIGADGVHSQVRQLSGFGRDWFYTGFALETTIPAADAARNDLTFDFETIRDGYGWVFPKADHLNIGLYCWSGQEKVDRARLSAYLESRYGRSGGYDATGQEVIGQYVGFGAAQHQPDSERIFLAGDAGGFVDPLTGEGIYFAIASGQASAAAIQAGIRGNGPAARHFLKATARLRSDLGTATAGARWFYSHLDRGYQLLSTPILQKAAVQAFTGGFRVGWIANLAKRAEKANLYYTKLQL